MKGLVFLKYVLISCLFIGLIACQTTRKSSSADVLVPEAVPQIIFITLDISRNSPGDPLKMEIIQQDIVRGTFKAASLHAISDKEPGHWRISLSDAEEVEKTFLITHNPMHQHIEAVDEHGHLFSKEVDHSHIEFPFRLKYHSSMLYLRVSEFGSDGSYNLLYQGKIQP